MTDTINIKIRGYHLDVFGHVNNARYLEFLEEARWALFDDKLGLEEMARDGFAFTVVNINISYRRPAFLHDTLCVETRLAKTGARSATLRQVVKNRKDAQTVAEADVTFVMLDVKKQKAAPLAGALTDTLIKAIES
jgi:thioesterase-3